MHWTLQLGVFLLGLGWTAFFLHPDPLSVFVEKRSGPDEEIHFTEFCLAPPSVRKSADASSETTSQLNKTVASSSEHQPATSPGPEMNDMGETTAPGSLTSSLKASEAAVSRLELPASSSADNSSMTSPPDTGLNLPCCTQYSPGIIDFSQVIGFIHQSTSELCPAKTVIFLTADDKEVCADPRAPWVLDYITRLIRQDSEESDLSQRVDEAEELDPDEPQTPGQDAEIRDLETSPPPTLKAPESRTTSQPIPTKKAAAAVSRKQPEVKHGVIDCCFTYSKVRIPLKYIQDFKFQASSLCPINTIIFVIRGGRTICVDSRDPWVQKFVTIIRKKLNRSRSSAMED